MRKPLIAGNWKMYKTANEAVLLVNSIKRELRDFDKADVIVCPPFTALDAAYEVLLNTNILLGAQNVYFEKEGAFTGEISPVMLKGVGCEYVIIGHSERRKYFGETDATINKKIRAILDIGLNSIVCVGETLEEREANKTMDVIKTQLEGCFKDIKADDMIAIVIAYEPVWAIGTGKNATPDQAEEVHKFIRGWIEAKYGAEIAAAIRIVYGGSVKPANIKELMAQPDLDGALVGGASLEAASFNQIVKGAVEDKVE
jgi:triosephosphate isomerase (TIM)